MQFYHLVLWSKKIHTPIKRTGLIQEAIHNREKKILDPWRGRAERSRNLLPMVHIVPLRVIREYSQLFLMHIGSLSFVFSFSNSQVIL